MKNIVLTGFMASGKTFVGEMLAKKTGRLFIDTDLLIEKRAKKSINDIFKDHGEEYFRDLESSIAFECACLSDAIISCGGGIVLREENITHLRKNGVIFNLNPTKEVIEKRLLSASATRPLLNKDDLSGALERFFKRKPYYDNCDYKIEVTSDKSVELIAEEILFLYKEE